MNQRPLFKLREVLRSIFHTETMKIIAKYSIRPAIMRSGLFAGLCVLAASCADESLSSPQSLERNIRFEVSLADDWKPGSSVTRGNGGADGNSLHVLTLSGGEKPLYLVPVAKDGISRGNASTRGSLVTTDDMESFGVFASISGTDSGPDYMCNEEVTADNGWQPAHEYRWPGKGSLHINAYSPYVNGVSQEGVISLPSPSDADALELGYKVPADVADQQDLMWSNPADASSSPCSLTFNHALTAIRFSTGSEMSPCTVKEINVNGVNNAGTLNLETGEWSAVEGDASYSVDPNITLSAGDGETYVAAGTPITQGDDTFILMPQTLDASASITLTVESNGSTVVLEASLDGQVWEAGKTITYRLSANPNPETLTLEVEGDFISAYTGSTDAFTVKSSYANGAESLPVKWIAEFVDNNGNVIEQPNWITSITASGNGDTDCTAETVMQDLVFDRISPQTQILQNAADINVTSGNTPYNLASSTGSSAVENTANCYVINAPGKYSLPLVYGNAVKNGSANTQAYTSTSHNSAALKNFVNHLGAAISDPYIYNNSGCTPASAELVWEDELNLVRNVALSTDNHSIEFDIPHNTIRQGNALVAVRDAGGNIMWSWQLWVTDYVPGSSVIELPMSSGSISFYPRSVGEVLGGDVTTFTETSVNVRFTQIEVPEGLEPLQKTVKFTQSGITISTPDCFTYYQWGRKDPMMSDVDQWYNSRHQEIKELSMNQLNTLPAGASVEQEWILTPDVFWECEHDFRFAHTNLWNANLSTTAHVKTVYDPSPVGAMVSAATTALLNLFKSATIKHITDDASLRPGFYITMPGGQELYFFALGYRSSSNGVATNQGELGEYWFETAVSSTESRALVLSSVSSSEPTIVLQGQSRGQAFGVRPMLEP